MKDECCPRFDSKKWDDKTFHWKEKHFIKETIPTLLHIPFPPMIGNRIVKMMKVANEAKMISSHKAEILMLFHDKNLFQTEIYISVIGEVINANNTHISGTFFAKTYEGGFSKVSKAIKEMNKHLEEKGRKARDYYIHYAYCPKCEKKFGNNYILIFAKLD